MNPRGRTPVSDPFAGTFAASELVETDTVVAGIAGLTVPQPIQVAFAFGVVVIFEGAAVVAEATEDEGEWFQ